MIKPKDIPVIDLIEKQHIAKDISRIADTLEGILAILEELSVEFVVEDEEDDEE